MKTSMHFFCLNSAVRVSPMGLRCLFDIMINNRLVFGGWTNRTNWRSKHFWVFIDCTKESIRACLIHKKKKQGKKRFLKSAFKSILINNASMIINIHVVFVDVLILTNIFSFYYRIPAACKCVALHPIYHWTRRFPTAQQWNPPTAIKWMQLVQTQRIWISPRCHHRHRRLHWAWIMRQTILKSVNRKTNDPVASWSFQLRRSWNQITTLKKAGVQKTGSRDRRIPHLLTCHRMIQRLKNMFQPPPRSISSSLLAIKTFLLNIHCYITRIN